MDGQYVGETQTINGKTYHTLYLYDDTGNIIGLQENGETYYLSRTLQGDVTAILDESGTKVARYVYDTWGNIVGVYDGADDEVTDPEHIALRNPFRYRGYMYDEESGLYYLQSRYYDPVTGRFVNADGFVSTGTGLMGHNMFAYCNDNPVMYVDPSGLRPVEEIRKDISDQKAAIEWAKNGIVNGTLPMDAEFMFYMTLKLKRYEDELANAVAWPTDGSDSNISSPYGPRQNPFTGEWEHHNGMDITPLTYGNADPIYSSMVGTIIASGYDSSMGNYIKIENAQYIITYMHMSKILIGSGTTIAGDTIGLMGRTGSATGVHLHFEVWDKVAGSTINPRTILN